MAAWRIPAPAALAGLISPAAILCLFIGFAVVRSDHSGELPTCALCNGHGEVIWTRDPHNRISVPFRDRCPACSGQGVSKHLETRSDVVSLESGAYDADSVLERCKTCGGVGYGYDYDREWPLFESCPICGGKGVGDNAVVKHNFSQELFVGVTQSAGYYNTLSDMIDDNVSRQNEEDLSECDPYIEPWDNYTREQIREHGASGSFWNSW